MLSSLHDGCVTYYEGMSATALTGHGRTVAFAVPLVLLTAIAHTAVGGAFP
ncbi:MAG: hypothetical protein RJB01_122, partial [Actinomycetota bacterium]